MSEAPESPNQGTKLKSLGGGEPPAELAEGLEELLRLPPSAREHFWDALGPVLRQPLPADLDERLDGFCAKHKTPAAQLGRAILACRMLLREAGRHGASRAELDEDLAKLSEHAGEIAAILLPGFDQAMAAVRQEILYGSLLDHGKQLVGLSWRVDSMLLSHRGDGLRSPVAMVTLRYREGEEESRITLQALPDMIREIRGMCDAILGPAERSD
ncbi:MAG: hypothetical protein JRI55_08270 [Deltaproteobacteria bacterium]|jgi:hypothetical protein|nr:hypothetical protein [Deltaproteobacteria bacterium]